MLSFKRTVLGGSLIAAAAVLVSGCSSGSGGVFPIGNSNGYYRVINGSPDAGAVDIAIDGSVQTGGPYSYTNIMSYRGFAAGSHTITVYQAGNDTSAGTLYSAAVPVNAGQDVTVVLDGERNPASAGNALGFAIFNEQPYSSTGGPYMNFHNAAPAVSGATGLNQPVQFGYTFNGTNTNVGSAGNVGAMTNPQTFSTNVGGSASLTFYGNWTAGSATTNVQTINSTCTTGLPCTTGNVSLYLVDGPGAVSGGSGAAAQFIGVFDNAGLITSGVIKK